MEDEIGFIIFLVILITPISFLGYFASKISCNSTANAMYKDHKFGIISGCLIKVKDEWVPLDNYRKID